LAKIKSFTKTYACDKPHYPYELPKGWVWTTLGEIFTLQAGKNITSNNISPTQNAEYKYPCFGGNGIRGYVASSNRSGNYPIIGRQGALCGNVNLATKEFYATEHAVVVDYYCETDLMWCYYTLEALNLNQYATATAQPGLAVNIINEVTIPLPPYKEQKEISDAIDSWFSLIDAIGKDKELLQTVIRQAKRKILDLAIHGKLVPQDPNDEPATELLKRINPKAEITCDNPQYGKLPKGWCLILGKDLYKPMKSAKPKGLVFKYIDIDSIDSSKQCVDCVKVVRIENAPSRASRYTQKGDIVFSMVRPYLKNIAIVSEDECIASTGFYICSPSDVAISEYCYYLMISDYTVNGLNQFMKGDNSPSINKSNIDNWLFPIPPLSEQHRIAAKIEELFAQLDKIESSLQA
jgi:type I restriction enzyme S subunit